MTQAAEALSPTGMRRWEALGEALTAKRLWLLIAAFEMALTLLSTLPGDVRKPILNLTAGFVSSAALLVVVGCGWFVLLRHLTGIARVGAAVPVFIAAAGMRGYVLQWLLVAWGISQPGVDRHRYRVFVSVVVVLTGALVGGLVKVTVDEHRRRLEHLDALQAQLSLVLKQSEVRLRADQSSAIDRIARDLSLQLAQVGTATPAVAIDSLERMAADVVRPLSHELAATTPTWSPPEPESLQRKLDWSEVWAAIASPGSISPLGPAVLTLVATPSSVFALGLDQGLLLHAVGAILVYVGLWTLSRATTVVAPQRSTLVQLALTTALLVLACVPAAIATWFLSGDQLRAVNTKYVLLVLPVVALMFAFIGSARAQQRSIDTAMAEVVAQTRWWLTRTRLVQWWQDATLARALHGPVQSTIRIASQRIQAATDRGDVRGEHIDSVIKDAAASLATVLAAPKATVAFHHRLVDVVAAWRPLVKIDAQVNDSAVQALDCDPICAEILIDIVAEAVSNAVRHGGARRVAVVVSGRGNTLHLQVTDDGRGMVAMINGASSPAGLGTRQLERCALSWDYRPADGGHCLEVELPLIPSPSSSGVLGQSFGEVPVVADGEHSDRKHHSHRQPHRQGANGKLRQ